MSPYFEMKSRAADPGRLGAGGNACGFHVGADSFRGRAPGAGPSAQPPAVQSVLDQPACALIVLSNVSSPPSIV